MDTKLTWQALLGVVRAHLGLHHTRQTLGRHDTVAAAFRTAKASLRARAAECGGDRDLYPVVRSQRVKIDRLEQELSIAHERIARYQYNAYKHGLKKHQLEETLPAIDRGRTA